MPFQAVSRTIEFLRRLQTASPVAMSFADDGEKFGFWPKTYQWVYEQGWLEQFFCALERESSWLATDTFSHYLDTMGANGTVYLPCGSYEEMLEWSGGYFRNFFVKYPEANAMYRKMLEISHRLQVVRRSAVRAQRSATPRANVKRNSKLATQHSKLLAQAQRELYTAQGNDAYWHGVFGGLYLAHLRRGVYRHLLSAEHWLDVCDGPPRPRQLRDTDGDGRLEVVLRTSELGVVLDPDEQATVTELAYYPRAVNLADTLTRRYEPYHEKLRARPKLAQAGVSQGTPASIHDLLGTKEAGLETVLFYDDHRRSSFVDYALATMPSLADVMRSSWSEHRLWSGGPWVLEAPRGAARDRVVASLSRRVNAGELRKEVILFRRSDRVEFQYRLSGLRVPVTALEWNLACLDERYRTPIEQDMVRQFDIRDRSLGVRVMMTIDPPARLLSFPIETVSESEEGLERTPQGQAVVLCWSTANVSDWTGRVQWAIEEWSGSG